MLGVISGISLTNSIEDFKPLKSLVFALFLNVVEESGFEKDKGVRKSSNYITSFRDMLQFFWITNSRVNVSWSDLMEASLFFTLLFVGADLLSSVHNFNFFIGA